ncbi:hypothetical protein LTR17_005313 [Elasticomyces elasticus]|nr:hypothetical protein LTR17_005313 [Elasticomyces elasticus]
MAMVATGAYAQSQYAQTVPNPTTTPSVGSQMSVALVTASASTSYTTVTYSDCPSLSMESMITVTNGITVTYCPECEMASSTSAQQPGHTTVYTTTYLSMCPTGLVPATYTVTESCTEPTPTWTPGPDHIPQGFTVTTQHCDACATPGPVTVTQPCGCEANEGTPVPAATTPASGGSGNTPAQTTPAPAGSAPAAPPAASASAVCELGDGQPQAGCLSDAPPASGGSGSGSNPPAGSAPAGSAPAPSGGSYGAGSPPASAGSAPGTTPAPGRLPVPAGSNAPYPTAKTTAAACPGPQCAAHGNTTGIEQSTGGAASFGVFSSAFMALVVAVFAFTL